MTATRRLAAILVADVAGYSRMMEADEAGTLAALKVRWKTILEPVVKEHGGRIVKLMGDGALVEFASAVKAVEAAVDLQEKFAAANKDLDEDRRIVLRIGINLGDVIGEGTDIYGDGVNIAARLEALAEAGGICISAKVHEEVRGKVAASFEDHGERALKNMLAPIRTFSIRPEVKSAEAGTASNHSVRPPPRPGSIAVLPFANMGGNPEQDYFAEGIAEDILTELQRFRNLFVIARNSSFSFKGKASSLSEIARALNVEYIVSGSVRRAGNRVRVAAQLAHAATGQEIWADRYDRELEDIFKVQDEVVRTIVVTLESRLGLAIASNAVNRNTPNLAAYECVQLAKKYFNGHDAPRAMPYVERALELDAGYAFAHAILSATHYVEFLENSQADALEKMEAAARMAVALDNSDSRGHALLGMALTFKRQYELAGSHLERAINLNPADAQALAYQAEWLVRNGDAAKALTVMDQLLQRDPIPPPWHWEIRAMALIMLGRYQEAILAVSKQVKQFWYLHAFLAICNVGLDQPEEAKADISKLLLLRPEMTIQQYQLLDDFRRKEDRDFIAESLRLAGLPE